METRRTRHEIGEGLQACAGFVLVVLVFTGMSGTLYKLLSPGGWLAHAFGRGFSAGIAAVLLLCGIGMVAWLSRGTQTTPARQRLANAIVWLFALAGLVYLVQVWTQGVF